MVIDFSPSPAILLMKHLPLEIRIGLDPGSSLTKVVYSIQDKLRYFYMEPEVLSLPVKPTTINFCSDPEHQAWLQLPQDENFYAVGQLAHQFNAIARLDKLKYEQALYKVLAAIGAIVQREQITTKFTVHLATVLPYVEYENRAPFRQKVAVALQEFEFRGQKMKGMLSAFYCSPEGGGHAWNFLAQRGKSEFKKNPVVILMLGHRDISCLTFIKGNIDPNHSKTVALGFTELLNRIIYRTAGLDESIASTIFQIGTDYHPDNLLIRSLVRSTQPENVIREAQEICEAIRVSRLEYGALVKNWLDRTLPSSLGTLIVGGGTGVYLKDDLTQILHWADPIWSEPIAVESADQDGKLLDPRMTDIIHLFNSCLARPVSIAQ
jgi:hypothetical protein